MSSNAGEVLATLIFGAALGGFVVFFIWMAVGTPNKIWDQAAAKHCAHIDSRAEYAKCVKEFVK